MLWPPPHAIIYSLFPVVWNPPTRKLITWAQVYTKITKTINYNELPILGQLSMCWLNGWLTTELTPQKYIITVFINALNPFMFSTSLSSIIFFNFPLIKSKSRHCFQSVGCPTALSTRQVTPETMQLCSKHDKISQGYLRFKVTGMIKEFFGVWNFDSGNFSGGKIWQVLSGVVWFE